VSQGDESLVDMTFQSRVQSPGDNDTLFYEKGMFNDWMASKPVTGDQESVNSGHWSR
jgi:hypothetical protein